MARRHLATRHNRDARALLLPLIVPIALGWLSWKLTKLLFRVLRLLAQCLGLTLPPLMVGRFRHAAAPLWVWLAGLLTLPVPASSWIWVLLGLALMLLSDRRNALERDGQTTVALPTAFAPAARVGSAADQAERAGETGEDDEGRRYVSARELRIAARVFAGVALAGGLGGAWWLQLLGVTAAVLVGAPMWWRDVSAPQEPMSLFEERWYAEVATPDPHLPSEVPDLEGAFVEWDDEAGRGVYRLSHADAWDVTKLAPKVERAFDQPPGTISLAADPRLSRQLLRVTVSDPSVGGRLRMFEGYSLQRDGRFIVGFTKGGVPVYGRLWNPGGALCLTIIAPPNMGKGSLLRLVVVECAASPDVLLFGADGKRGGGMGYLKTAFHTLTTNHDASVDLIHGFLLAVRERQERYGDAGEDGYYVRNLDPRLLLAIDEPRWIIAHEPRVADWLREITGTSRSVGAGLALTLHKGDGPSYGDTETRSNAITNGIRAIGPAPDNQAKSTALQGDDFDPSTLPSEPGWFGLVGRPLEAPPTPVRTLWLPNDLDVRRGMADDVTGLLTELDLAPNGTVQQWLERDTVHPELHPATLEALLRPAQDRAAARAKAEQHAAARAEQAHDQAAEAAEGPADGWSRIEATLREHPDGLLRFEIAEKAGLSAGHTSFLLKDRRENRGDVVQNTNKTWRLAS